MNTPETDKRVWSDHSEGILHEVVEASFARKLERERDDAQNKLRLEKLTIISQKEEIELLRQQLIEARNK
jgi:hypothetical protein